MEIHFTRHQLGMKATTTPDGDLLGLLVSTRAGVRDPRPLLFSVPPPPWMWSPFGLLTPCFAPKLLGVSRSVRPPPP